MMRIGVCTLAQSHCTIINPSDTEPCHEHDRKWLYFKLTGHEEDTFRALVNSDEVTDGQVLGFTRKLLDDFKRKSSL